MAKVTPGEMLPQERRQWILDRLRQRGRVVALELATEFAVSEDSVRRDLRELAARGLCKRVYGGALPLSAAVAPLKQRRHEHAGRKLALARKAVALVRQGQILLERVGFEILLIGGCIDARIGAAIGAQAVHEIQRVRADLCFPGACAVDAIGGLWGFDSEEALLKRAMVGVSGEVVVVATSDKLGTVATHRVAGIDEVQHLVVEHEVGRALRATFSARGMTVHRAEAPAA